MERNVGGTDRTLRIVVGLIFVGVSMGLVAFGDSLETTLQGGLAALALLVAAILLATAGARTCPLNALVGRNTCEDRRRS
ncbi:YgaP family membrane protein [Natronobeatus ordinarius]|uniref:YgaP family membrane protein n=1 Tax=Natronobeatus ordinarius TaxID=2963433 RepID=UPI0020CBA214|nr:DUF2892 domain-containing protein [Natronobeatus ordinarius]